MAVGNGAFAFRVWEPSLKWISAGDFPASSPLGTSEGIDKTSREGDSHRFAGLLEVAVLGRATPTPEYRLGAFVNSFEKFGFSPVTHRLLVDPTVAKSHHAFGRQVGQPCNKGQGYTMAARHLIGTGTHLGCNRSTERRPDALFAACSDPGSGHPDSAPSLALPRTARHPRDTTAGGAYRPCGCRLPSASTVARLNASNPRIIRQGQEAICHANSRRIWHVGRPSPAGRSEWLGTLVATTNNSCCPGARGIHRAGGEGSTDRTCDA